MTDATTNESTPAGQPSPSPAAAAPGPDAPKKGRGKALAIAGTVFAVAGLSWLGYDLLYGQYHEHTDDAYVQANLVYVNAQVGGTVTALGADDNQPVKAGQTLVTLDHADAAVAQADAEAQLALAVRQVREQLGNVAAAQAVVAQRRTELARAGDDLARRQSLAGTDSVAAEEITHARQAVAAAQDALAVAERQLETARAPVAGTTLRDNPSVLRARAAFVQAALGTQRNDVQAPTDGVVARRSVQVGQRVAAGTALMAVVPLQGAWIDANFKEPQLRHIQVGQPAIVSTDLYGGHIEYHGTVASIAAGSGGAFSLLPPQNATGNWIKVVQRVPVRIALDPRELAAHPLRVGLSTDVTVDTERRADREPPAQPLPGANFATTIFDAQLRTAEARADALIAREAGSAQ
ncbi:MAG: efflux RND transporter periplasmic adaptor subunit [Burkholderiaceae bacterium]